MRKINILYNIKLNIVKIFLHINNDSLIYVCFFDWILCHNYQVQKLKKNF